MPTPAPAHHLVNRLEAIETKMTGLAAERATIIDNAISDLDWMGTSYVRTVLKYSDHIKAGDLVHITETHYKDGQGARPGRAPSRGLPRALVPQGRGDPLGARERTLSASSTSAPSGRSQRSSMTGSASKRTDAQLGSTVGVNHHGTSAIQPANEKAPGFRGPFLWAIPDSN